MTSASAAPKILNPLPVELAPGVFWLGECAEVIYKGTVLHGSTSSYLVAGEKHCALVDAGFTRVSVLMDQIETLISERGLPDVRYVFLTHSEFPHSGGVGHVLHRFPEAIAYGGVSDMHLIFPLLADRFRFSEPGDTLDLGGTELRVIEGVFRDMPYTRWAFDTRRRVLFPGDGFAFTHEHDARQCGHLTEDAKSLDIPAMMALFAVAAFHWVEYVDIEPYLTRLDELVFEELAVELIAPTHGLPIGDPGATLPAIREGLRRVSHSVSEGLLEKPLPQ
jgi:flavorubredoxin